MLDEAKSSKTTMRRIKLCHDHKLRDDSRIAARITNLRIFDRVYCIKIMPRYAFFLALDSSMPDFILIAAPNH
jgi:hypothetical protein